MFKKIKITTKFFLITLLLSVVSVLAVSVFVNRMIQKVVMERTRTYVAEFVQLQTIKNLDKVVSFSQFVPNTATTDSFFQEVLNNIKTDDILRIKVWAPNGDVIFSENKDIVGKNFKENEEFQEAMGGEGTIVDIQAPNKADNASEQGYSQLMEVYIPILFNNQSKPIGVVEIYYKLDRINQLVWDAELTVISIIIGINLLFFVSLVLFFNLVIKKPIVNVVRVANEISKGNMSVDIKTVRQDEIGELLVSIDRMRNSLKIVLEEYEKKVSPTDGADNNK